MRWSKTTITACLFTVGIFSLSIFWYFVETDTFCLTRTGLEPNALYATDTSTFAVAVEGARTHAVRSLIHQFDSETGFFIYSQHPNGTRSEENNDIRQLLGSRILAREANLDESIRILHEQNLSVIFRDWYREEDGIGYVYVDEKSKLGANAMLLRVLVASPDFEQHRAQAQRLVRGIISLIENNGSFVPWFKKPSYEYDAEYLLTFYSGEAVLALLEYAKKSGDSETFEVAQYVEDFYIGEYVDRIADNYYPAYVPWHTLALAELYAMTNNMKYVHAIFVLNDKLLLLQDNKKYIGRFFDPTTPEYGTSPHASSDGVYTEGLAVAYGVARAVGNTEHEVRYKSALIHAFHNLTRLQLQPNQFRILDNDEVVDWLKGGMMTNVCSRWVRIDSTAHAIDAFEALINALVKESKAN